MSTLLSSPLDLYYLGPQGSFTHQAAGQTADLIQSRLGCEVILRSCDQANKIVRAVEEGRGLGVIAWENNVEGYVVPNLDALIDSEHVAGFYRTSQSIIFDAFVRPDHGTLTRVIAHPHGLAQCQEFIHTSGLGQEAASSNAAACRDIKQDQVALGPSLCGSLYGLETWQRGVQDYRGARTDFLLLGPRQIAADLARTMAGELGTVGRVSGGMVEATPAQGEFESIVTFIPLHTGPGVLADLLDQLRDAGLNMTSFMSRPIKGNDGTYSFIAAIDAAPWEPALHKVMGDLFKKGDWLKTLAVYPRRERPDPPIPEWMLPRGGAWQGGTVNTVDMAGVGKELLW